MGTPPLRCSGGGTAVPNPWRHHRTSDARRERVPMSQNPSVTSNAPVSIRVEQVDLLSVTGQLDDPGLDRLQRRFDELLDGGGRLLVADLSGVAGCDGRLFEVLARTQDLVGGRGGWLRLVGLGSPVLDALDQAALPDVLLVYRAARWAGHGVH